MRSAISASITSKNRPYWCNFCTDIIIKKRSIGAETTPHFIGKYEKLDRCRNCTCSRSCHLAERGRAQEYAAGNELSQRRITKIRFGRFHIGSVKAALKLHERSLKRRAYASTTDPVRRHCDLGEASALVEQSTAIPIPFKSLITGFRAASLLPRIIRCQEGGKALRQPYLRNPLLTGNVASNSSLQGQLLQSKMFVFNPTAHTSFVRNLYGI